uniref:Uncharacterized protein n=1 Tax=Psilocybe cubensis TaxID=181762 RepID=A0A8H8CJ16_PSICU
MPVVHYLLSTTPQWGHVKPLCIFATRIVQERESAILTIMVAPNLLDKAFAEVSAQSSGIWLPKWGNIPRKLV